MRLLIPLLLLLLPVLFSCHSSRQTESSYTGTTALSLDSTHAKQVSYDIFSYLRSTRQLELTGITVEFFPPLVGNPDSVPEPKPGVAPRASPKSLRIESVKSRENTSDSIHEFSDSDERQTVNLSDSSDVSDNRTTEVESSSGFRPFWLILLSIPIASVFLGWYMRKSGPPP